MKGAPTPLEVIADKYIVEQHKDNPNKCHIYFFSEIPFPKRDSDTNKPGFNPEQQPAFEVKGEGSHGIAYCTPLLHKHGHHYEIIGTADPVLLGASAQRK